MAKQQDKLSVLRGILSGTYPISKLSKPQVYVVDKEGDRYRVARQGGEEAWITEEEYQEWCKNNVREVDLVILYCRQEGNEPLIELPPNEERPALDANKPHADNKRSRRTRWFNKDKEPKETPKSTLETPIEKPKERKTSGLMSEYGITWGPTEANDLD